LDIIPIVRNLYTTGMPVPSTFVPTAEAAFIAGLSDREMNRVVDEHILPDALFRVDHGRWFARLGAAFASFFFGTERLFVAGLRRQIMIDLVLRLERHADKDAVFALASNPRDLDWLVAVPNAQIDATSFIVDAWERVGRIERAHLLVTSDPEVLGGLEVFAGTRVPIDTVTSSLERGVALKRLTASYPFLTAEHVEAARVYAAVHPKRGRPRRIADAHPNWKVKSTRLIRTPAKA
jgi:uncharacterized protein (DUF433 family)